MAARWLEGKPVAEQVLADVARRVAVLRARGVVPGLATILVGDDAASAGYVRKKHEACALAGLHSENVRLPASTTQAELHATIRRLSGDATVHGFLLQHLLPDVAESVAEKASWLTPRLGGVGVTTVAMLLQNTVQLAERA